EGHAARARAAVRRRAARAFARERDHAVALEALVQEGMSALRAFAVVDLGFGDAGKGLLTDWLARRTGASVIVRFNGGAQAGHNVVTEDGRHHTFAQIGAGSFVPGVRTFLSRHVVVH